MRIIHKKNLRPTRPGKSRRSLALACSPRPPQGRAVYSAAGYNTGHREEVVLLPWPQGTHTVDLPPLEILYEDNHCLAISKPSGALSTHYEGKEETLDRQVKAYLKEKYRKPGDVFLGVVHRLDKPVSGVLLFARTSKAADRIAR